MLCDLDSNLSEVLLVEHVLIGLFQLFQTELLFVNNRMNIVSFDSLVHVLKLHARANKKASYCAQVTQTIQECRLLLGRAANKTNDGYYTVDGDGFERLSNGGGSADFDDVLHTSSVARQCLGLLAPVGSFAVVYDVISTQLLQ